MKENKSTGRGLQQGLTEIRHLSIDISNSLVGHQARWARLAPSLQAGILVFVLTISEAVACDERINRRAERTQLHSGNPRRVSRIKKSVFHEIAIPESVVPSQSTLG